ncbi:MAG: beta-eliminating lyase-related protein [Pseudomonadota bacterium]
MDFSSDTSAPAHPSLIEALSRVNSGMEGSYGNDSTTERVRSLLADTLETNDFDFWICASGTASNSLALSLICPPTGSILCHKEAHIERDERGAPEFFTGGGKLALLPGDAARIDEAALQNALAGIQRDFVHETPPHVLSLTNLTESGAAYPVDQIAHYAELAHAAGLRVHLDGARLGNALVFTGASPAEMSWKADVDILTLGLTKTGAIGCELILLFGDMRKKFGELQARAKRSGHMPPKMRFLAAQAEALLTDNLWLTLSGKANTQAKRLAEALCVLPGVELRYPVDGNEVFVALPDSIADKLQSSGAKFYPWPGGCYRFVCAWSTTDAEVDALVDVMATT